MPVHVSVTGEVVVVVGDVAVSEPQALLPISTRSLCPRHETRKTSRKDSAIES